MRGVRLESLSKQYGEVAAVRALSLTIQPGEFLVLLGPSGCGKTTTLRLIAGLEAASAGRIFIGDRDVTGLPPRARDIAMVFQNYALYPHMSVRENLGFGLRMRGTPRRDVARQVDAVAETLGIAELLERRPAALSGGQRQRVALGRALVREPAVFLFDEPLSNLDARLRIHTRAELVRLHQQLGTTMVYVTHDQTEAMTMGERIAVLDRGELQQLGAPLEVYDRPANLMVAGFIGAPPMNLVPGTLERDGAQWRFSGGGLSLSLPAHAVGPGGSDRRRGDVVLGIRPEGLRPLAESGGRSAQERVPVAAVGRAEVGVVEPLGSETLVHVRSTAGADLVARLAGRARFLPGEVVTLAVNAEGVHLFDAATGRRIESDGRGDGGDGAGQAWKAR